MIIPHSRPTIDQDDVEAVSKTLASGCIAQGGKVREFEKQTARFVGVKHAVACSSGTTALHLALLSLGANSKDEIIMPSYVCSSPYFATVHTGAKPRIADIDSKDLNICAKTAKKHLSFKTKAIIVPHMFGNSAELDELLNLGVPIIEDCAQALGAEYNKRRIGSVGDLSIFSFYATKMITTGEGGMVLTNNSEYYHRIIEARDYDKKPLTPTKYNYKMTDFQAALGLSQLKKLHRFINRRRKIASHYTSELSEHVLAAPTEHTHKTTVHYRYVVMIDKLEEIQRKAKEKGVQCEKPVWKPLHKHLPNLKCPNSDYAHAHALSIPLYPSLREEEIEHVTRTLKALFKKHSPP
jgi:perosamine synthetase